LQSFLLVFCGGGLGCSIRFIIYNLMQFNGISSLYGTLCVNIIGSFIIGILSCHPSIDRLFWIVGFLGGFTTFSTLALDLHTLLNNKNNEMALIYTAISFLGGLYAVYLGIHCGRRLFYS
jgi:CrcB protein